MQPRSEAKVMDIERRPVTIVKVRRFGKEELVLQEVTRSEVISTVIKPIARFEKVPS
jgi:hypothetical protein